MCGMQAPDSDHRKGPRFCFPVRNPALLDRWRKSIGLEESMVVKATDVICGLHFVKSDFFPRRPMQKYTLKPGAVPSIRLKISNHGSSPVQLHTAVDQVN